MPAQHDVANKLNNGCVLLNFHALSVAIILFSVKYYFKKYGNDEESQEKSQAFWEHLAYNQHFIVILFLLVCLASEPMGIRSIFNLARNLLYTIG